MSTNFSTPDLCDEHSDVQILSAGFFSYGRRTHFAGEIVTIKCFEDNSLVKEQVGMPGNGRVLVVDAGGSMRCAMLGDQLAQKASDNGWSGVLLYGCIRDVEIIADIDIGVKALGVHPRKSVKKGIGELNIPIYFCEAHIKPGYYLYSDANGIVISERALL